VSYEVGSGELLDGIDEAVESLAKTATSKLLKEPLRRAGVTPRTWDRESVGYKIARRV